ncbi:MAG: hypothetical protein JJU03_11550 [Idiomarina sp.]|nr:hypothetical protein [Idiomarina sp.]
MTNPLLKVTLILLSLSSAVFFGQAILSSSQNTSVNTQGLSIQATDLVDSRFELPATQSQQTSQPFSKRQAAGDTPPSQDSNSSTPARQHASPSQDSRRSFSFHYLDILEWMFAGRGEKAKQRQSQRPSASLGAW